MEIAYVGSTRTQYMNTLFSHRVAIINFLTRPHKKIVTDALKELTSFMKIPDEEFGEKDISLFLSISIGASSIILAEIKQQNNDLAWLSLPSVALLVCPALALITQEFDDTQSILLYNKTPDWNTYFSSWKAGVCASCDDTFRVPKGTTKKGFYDAASIAASTKQIKAPTPEHIEDKVGNYDHSKKSSEVVRRIPVVHTR
jgi:hypothetical protein